MFGGTVEAAIGRQPAINAQVAQQAIDLAEIDVLREHEALGFSSVVSFGRVKLGLNRRAVRELVRVGQALRDLPDVRAAALAGELSFEHLKSFEYGIRIVGRSETIEAEEALLTVARATDAEDFHHVLRRMHEAAPDELDAAWQRGMDKRDLTLSKTLEGWHLAGFLPIELGTKLKTILESLSVPYESGDIRMPSERRIEGLEKLCDSVLEHGLPASNGIKPQLRIVIDVDDEQTHAKLEKFGPIGPALLAHLACEADWLTIKTRNREVLDVGRRHRFATAKQTEAILQRQDGICAGPGCNHPIAHIHHQTPWSYGGRTDLDDLIGYCGKCHSLEHQGRLTAKPRAG